MFRIMIVLSLTTFITSCASATRVVVLQHPETKQTTECRVDPFGAINRTAQIEDCITAYKKAGYKVVGDSEW